MVPTVGGVGVARATSISTLPLTPEVQPTEFVTVKVYVPEAKPDTVVVGLLPVIVVIVPPKSRDNVQLPDGKPLNTTLPVPKAQVGWVMVPTTGAVGTGNGTPIDILLELPEVQPSAFVTVNVYVLEVKPETVVVGPLPELDTCTPLLIRVSSHVPLGGKPVKVTEPVSTVQVGFEDELMIGAGGAAGSVNVWGVELLPIQPFTVIEKAEYVPWAKSFKVNASAVT